MEQSRVNEASLLGEREEDLSGENWAVSLSRYCREWLYQTSALSQKQLRVTSRRPISLLVRFCLPFLCIIAVWQLEEKAGGEIVPLFGGFMLLFAFFCSSTIVEYAAVEERRAELLGVMRRIGLHESVHVASWIISSALPSIVLAILAVATGVFCQLDVFKRCNFLIMFLLFFLSDVAFCAASLWVGSVITRQWLLYSATFLTLAGAMLFHFFWVLISIGQTNLNCCILPDGVTDPTCGEVSCHSSLGDPPPHTCSLPSRS
jgi:hypothetical protein